MQDNVLGQISPGFYADFVVLRKDVSEDHAALVMPDLVEGVWVAGKKTYQYDPTSIVLESSEHDLSKSLLPGKNGPSRPKRIARGTFEAGLASICEGKSSNEIRFEPRIAQAS
ncbi:hypothetical protein F441_20047 [Phytophthora nicotianae CJ01A1]|uniref:Amidohydrolase 3 domain-containing protein n=1 Tax=Phytophthora nicotianae CJ01A1 TaxID=1317063 RepID=W2VXC9_PHYNI|nr:hypothetical protein F441_20047 [Phytophthora nicotianae CJ01A1]